jgi:hypothetical protein
MSRIISWQMLPVLVIAAVSVCGQQSAVTADPFGPLKFLVGTWPGEQSGEPGKGISDRTYTFVLSNQFLEVRILQRIHRKRRIRPAQGRLFQAWTVGAPGKNLGATK